MQSLSQFPLAVIEVGSVADIVGSLAAIVALLIAFRANSIARQAQREQAEAESKRREWEEKRAQEDHKRQEERREEDRQRQESREAWEKEQAKKAEAEQASRLEWQKEQAAIADKREKERDDRQQSAKLSPIWAIAPDNRWGLLIRCKDELNNVRIEVNGNDMADAYEVRRLMPGTYFVASTPDGRYGPREWGSLEQLRKEFEGELLLKARDSHYVIGYSFESMIGGERWKSPKCSV